MSTGVVLQIEPTDLCNLACPMCGPQVRAGDVHAGLRPGFMDMALYRGVIDDLRAHGFDLDHLILQWLGEPTLHPELVEMITLAAEGLAGLVGYIRVDTNAVALTPSRIDGLLERLAAADHPTVLLVFSLDAATPETYRRVKGRDRFDQVMANIGHLLRRRGELPGDDPGINVQLQFVLQPDNHHEVAAFVDHWDRELAIGRHGIGFNEVMIKRLSAGTGGPRQRELDDLYDRTIAGAGLRPFDRRHLHLRLWTDRTWGGDEPGADAGGRDAASDAGGSTGDAPSGGSAGGRPPCPAPWLTPVIRWDGEVMVCCADVDGAIAVGNVRDHGFVSLWTGARMEAVRLAHLRGDLDGIPLCRSCGGFTVYRLDAERARDTLERAGRMDLWPEVSRRLP